MTQIKITEISTNALALEIDPLIFNDIDAAEAGENYNCEINFADSDFDCEHESCDNQTLPSISFLDLSPAQSIMTNCLAHYPAVNDFVSANR